MSRPLRSTIRALAGAAFATAALAAASPAAAVEVTIEPPGRSAVTISTDEIANPEIDATYTIRRRGGGETKVKVEDGVSIRQLLEEADADLGYAMVDIARPDGSVLRLSRDQIDSPTPPPPVIYTDSAGVTWFLRSPTGPDDANAADKLRLGSSLTLRQRRRSTLSVTVSAGRKRIGPGESVTFKASATGGPAGAAYVFHWDFGDGETERSETGRISHRFDERGEYRMFVEASVAGSGRSDPAGVRIVVGDPEQSDEDRTGGGTNTADGAPDSGAFDGSGGAGAPYGSSTYTSPTTPPTPTPQPLPPPTSTPQPSKPPPIATDGTTTVAGNLLADAGEPPPTSVLESAARAARDGQRRDDDDSDGASVPEAALSVAGLLALLGLGAGMELRQGRPRRTA